LGHVPLCSTCEKCEINGGDAYYNGIRDTSTN
jgi:hypothetical protein